LYAGYASLGLAGLAKWATARSASKRAAQRCLDVVKDAELDFDAAAKFLVDDVVVGEQALVFRGNGPDKLDHFALDNVHFRYGGDGAMAASFYFRPLGSLQTDVARSSRRRHALGRQARQCCAAARCAWPRARRTRSSVHGGAFDCANEEARLCQRRSTFADDSEEALFPHLCRQRSSPLCGPSLQLLSSPPRRSLRRSLSTVVRLGGR
jgi:hypothetical protein